MARSDVVGFFWDDTPPPKPPPKEKPKCVPPDPVWLLPTYLPGLEKARAMRPNLFSDAELVIAQAKGERLVWDIECYPNYFLVAFKSVVTGKIVYFELGEGVPLDIPKLAWVLRAFVLIDYNGNKYDVPIVSLALAGKTNQDLQNATTSIIKPSVVGKNGKLERPGDVLRRYKTKREQLDHIDLFELVALHPSLKLLAGRLHAPRMQDLPFAPGTTLSDDQIAIVRWYCINDLDNTELLYRELLPDIELREEMSVRYGLDLRSHSDAQIAETVLASEISKALNGTRINRPVIAPGTMYKYRVPAFIQFQSETLKWVLEQVKASWFQVAANGKTLLPDEIKNLKIPIGDSIYRIGRGGLHSSEKRAAHIADENVVLLDRDVASYYPRIILNCLLAPAHLGSTFLRIYNTIVNDRLDAKHKGLKTAANALKIVINGSFGKLGSKWSKLYAPDLMIQVTITGQLALLMLIERLVLAGIPVVSANTDGIIIKCQKIDLARCEAVIKQWEIDTNFETEETRYKGVFSRDVNNYIAIKEEGGEVGARYLDQQLGCKTKGVYSERGSSRDTILSKNPTSLICNDAVIKMLTTGVPVLETIRSCADIRRFVSVRTVKGGAVKDGEYLGKAVRWYYAEGEEGVIVYAKSGNKVPRSEGAKPCMELPTEFPQDVDFAWYEEEANKILKKIGFAVGEVESEVEDDEGDEDDEVIEDEEEALMG